MLLSERVERLEGPDGSRPKYRCKPCNNAGFWHCSDPLRCGFMLVVDEKTGEEHALDNPKARGL